MTNPSQEQVKAAVKACAPHSDRGEEGLLGWATAFIDAHQRSPGGLSIEIGARAGGSGLLFLKLIELLYPAEMDRPLLVSVDPYGFKPYDGGAGFGGPIYGHGAYLMQRKLLADWPNHAHFLMASTEFFARMNGAKYWVPTPQLVEVFEAEQNAKVMLPTGQPRLFGTQDTTFVLLDGDHDAWTIAQELEALWRRWMRPNGVVVVDNADCDPRTETVLVNYAHARPAKEWAVVTGRR